MGFSRRASKLNRAVFEALETRQLMSAVTWQVTNTSNDPTVSGSLPWAVVQANHDSGDTISFSTLPNGSDIYLAGPLDIQSNVTITGLGRTNLTIDGGSTSNIFTVESGVTATITGLTLADGNASGNGGAILNSGDLNLDGCVFLNNIAGGSGGAIYNAGALEVTNTTFSGDKATGNVAGNGGGGIYNVNFATILTSSFTNEGALDGGGLYNTGTVTVSDSTFTLDAASGTVLGGGAMYNDGIASIFNSTLFANTAVNGGGGGVDNDTDGFLTIVNSTLTQNKAFNGGGIATEPGVSDATIYNTIVDGNLLSNASGTFADISGSLDANPGADNYDVQPSSNNLIGTGGSGGALASNNNQLNVANPGLASALSTSPGSPTATIALMSKSPAIDRGSNSFAFDPDLQPLMTDQRGYYRVDNGTVDIGAYEYNAPAAPTTLMVNTGQDFINYTPGFLSLRQAVGFADFVDGSSSISFDSTVFTGATPPQIVLTNGTIEFTNPTGTVTLNGISPGESLVTISGNDSSSIFKFDFGATVNLSYLTLTDAMNAFGNGGAIGVDGTLTINSVAFTGNTGGNGGAIYDNGTVTLTGASFTSNDAQIGGAVYDNGESFLSDNDSTYVNNAAQSGGGALYNSGTATITGDDFSINQAPNGAAVYNAGGSTIYINGGQMSGDEAASQGGGIFNKGNVYANAVVITGEGAADGAGVYNNEGNITLTSVTVTMSTASGAGGGIFNTGNLSVVSSLVTYDAAGGGDGGGLSNEGGGNVNIVTTTFDHDTASGGSAGGGAIYNNGSGLVIESSTFSNDTVGGSLSGGGIYNDVTDSLEIENSTFAGDSAPDGLGGGLFNKGQFIGANDTFARNTASQGGGLYAATAIGGFNTIYNTIVACNIAGDGSPNVGGELGAASAYNLVGVGGYGGLSATNNQLGVAHPLLSALGNYGGVVQTICPLPGSTAIDGGGDSFAVDSTDKTLATDARGLPRFEGEAVDIGADETGGYKLVAAANSSPQSALTNNAFANPLAVTITANNGDDRVEGGVIYFTAPSSGASAVLSPQDYATISGGAASVSAAANNLVGTYNVVASAYPGALAAYYSASNATFTLTNYVEIDLNVTKTVSNSTPNVGTNITYTVTVSNASGFSGATDAAVADMLPCGESYVSSSATLGSYNSVSGVWTVGNLAAGATATLTYTVTVNAFAPLTNTASATADQPDLNANPSASVTINPQEIDLSITKTVSNSTPNVGGDVTYIVTVSNASGFSAASNIAVTDLLPGGETLVSGQVGYSGGIWSIASLAPGATATLTYVAAVNVFAPLTNTATVTASDQPDFSGNPSATVTVNPQEIDLTVTKTVDNSTPNVNGMVNYTVTLTNVAGFSAATNISLKDLLPAGETLVSATPSAGSYNAISGVWTLSSLVSGSSVTLQIAATVNVYAPITNTATVTAAYQTDTDANPTASVTINPQEIDLTVTKTAASGTVNNGGTDTFTVTVSNATGYTTATNISLTDLIPAGETITGTPTASAGAFTGGTWVIPSLSGGSSVTLTYTATVTGTFPSAGGLTDTATITGASQTADIGTQLSASATVCPQMIDLSVGKSAATSTVNNGGTDTFTVTVVNAAGYSTATNISLTDVLPAGETITGTPTASAGAFSISNGTWVIPSLSGGSSVTLTYVATVTGTFPSPSAPSLTDTATITSASQPDATSNPTASAMVYPQMIDLSVAKSAVSGNVNNGASDTFTIVVSNAAGYSAATNISLTDVLPAGETITGTPTASAGAFSISNGTWVIPTLSGGSSVTLTYSATVTGTFPSSSAPSLTDTATVTYADQPDVTASPTASATVYPHEIDLNVTKTVDNSTPFQGGDVTYTVTLSNASGYSAATDVAITDMLPAGEALVSATTAQGSYDASTGIWSIGTVSACGTATLSVVANIVALGEQTNTAAVTAADQIDFNANPTAFVNVNPQQVIATGPSQVDLNVSDTPSNSSPNVGANDTYTVTVSNFAGFANATNVALTNYLPAGETYVLSSASFSQGSYNSVSGVWTIGSLNAGSSATLTYVATVTARAAQTSTATVTAVDQSDFNTNPTASVTVNPQEIDLNVTKTVNVSNPNVGSNVIYTVTVCNASGYTAASNINVNDILPAGETFVSATPSTGTYNPTTGLWLIPSLAGGTSATLNVTATVTAFASNTISATLTGLDPNLFGTINLQGSSPVNGGIGNLLWSGPSGNQAPFSGSFNTYCIDLLQDIYFGGTYSYNIESLASAPQPGAYPDGIPTTGMGAAKADELAALFGVDYSQTLGESAAEETAKTAFQLAIWNIVYDTDAAVSNGAGTLYVSSGVDANTISVANGFIADALNPANQKYDATDLVALVGQNGAQDQIAIDPQLGFINTAMVTSADQTDAGTQLSASAAISPQEVDLNVTKTVNISNSNVNTLATYTVTVSNAVGYSNATNVALQDLLPASETLVSATPSLGSYNATTGAWSVGALNAGSTATLTVVANVTAAAYPSVTNTATLTAVDQTEAGTTLSASVTVNPQEIELNVTKTASNLTPNVGTNVTYTVTVSNAAGYSAATDVALKDLLPASETLVSAVATLGTYNPANGAWSVGTLNSGATATLTVVATVTAAAYPSVTNTASVTAADQTDFGTTLSASVTVNPQEIDLNVTKTVNNLTPNVGTNVTYTVTVNNATGYSTATGISLQDLLPAGETFVSAIPSSGSYNSTTGYWSISSLGAGASATLQVTATVAAFKALTNTATVTSSAQSDLNANPTASVTVNPQEIDLNVTKTVNLSNPNVNTLATYTVTVSNAAGYSNATDVALKDLLPASETLVSATPSLGSYNAATGAWTVGTLNTGSSATLTVVATVTAAAYPSVTNTASITAADQTDVGTALTASAVINPQEIDLNVTKTVNNATPNVGANVTYTVTVSNATGYTQATNVSVSDLLPSGETLVSATGSAGTSYAGGIWTVGNLAAGASATLNVVATVGAGALPSATNTAKASATQYDANPNPQASVTVYPQEIDLSVVKTESTPQICEGSNVTYTVTVSNAAGYSTATNVLVTDQLPSGLTFVTTTPSVGTYNQSTGAWSVGTLASGASATLTVVAKAACYGIDVNTAAITSATQVDIGTALSSSVTLVVGASVNGTVYVDSNGDLTQDSGEQGQANATVELIDASGYVVLTTTTNTSGQYSFAGVAPGNYQVEFFAATGYQFDVINGVATSNSNNNNNCGNDNYGSCGHGNGYGSGYDNCGTSYNFTCGAQTYCGYADSSCGSGYTYSSCGKSYCYNFCDNDHGGDCNNYGCGWSGNGWNGGCSQQHWCGSYCCGGNNCGNNNNNCNNPVGYTCVTLVCGTTTSGVNAGIYLPGAIGSYVWVDANHDGLDDNGESGLGGVCVQLLSSNGKSVLEQTSTNCQGYYSFTNLAPGQYVVQFSDPCGYAFTTEGVGSNNAINSQANPSNGQTSVITLMSGTTNDDENAGVFKPASVSGAVYVDYYNDGQFDCNDAGIAGVTVQLLNSAGQVVQTTTTACDGTYNFNNVAPGTYSINEPQSQNALQGSNAGKDSAGTVGWNTDGTGSTAGVITNIVLGSGSNGSNYDFGQTANGQTLGLGDCGTVGFWTSQNGQTLLDSLNGGSNATTLGNWLANNYANLYGKTCGGNNLTGKSNSAIFQLLQNLCNCSSTQCNAQVLACAINTYATDTTLCGTAAASYGFNVSSTGCGNKDFNVWVYGQAAGASNYSVLTVQQIVNYCNSKAKNGILYSGNSTLIWDADNIFLAINQAGGIGSDV
jgi:uncharacterized repeat protein (TIGR01451 family)